MSERVTGPRPSRRNELVASLAWAWQSLVRPPDGEAAWQQDSHARASAARPSSAETAAEANDRD